MHWLVYALGGGLGHLTRSVALARAAGRRGVRSTILTNSPFVDCVPVERELAAGDRLVAIPSGLDFESTAARVVSLIDEIEFDLLVVDTFPRGLGGELADLLPTLRVPKALVHRDLNPKYVSSYHVADFATTYECVLLPGEGSSLASLRDTVRTEHWLIRDAEELLPREDARRALIGCLNPAGGEVDDEVPIVLVSGCGRAVEVEQMRELAAWLRDQVAERACVCFVSPECSVSPDGGDNGRWEIDGGDANWPVFRLFGGVDVFIGAGGYNSIAEARAADVPLLAFARPRLYDRQARRLTDDERIVDLEQLLQSLEGLLARRGASRRPIRFQNGAHQAVEILTGLLS